MVATSVVEETDDFLKYKAAKEAFVSDLTGTTIFEIFWVCLPIIVNIWTLNEIKALQNLCFQSKTTKINNNKIQKTPILYFWCNIILEYIVIILPSIICITKTNYAPIVVGLSVLLALCCKFITRITIKKSDDKEEKIIEWKEELVRCIQDYRYPFVGNCRAGIMILSCISILAVDFSIYPRRFGKTETFGTGLMDMGVGSFVFSSGIISRYARQHLGTVVKDKPVIKGKIDLSMTLTGAFKRSWPLILIGGIRCVLTKGIEYQEHVSEYGVHWNFFLSLAGINIGSTLVHKVFSQFGNNGYHQLMVALMIGITYQLFLIKSLSNYVINAPRLSDSFFSQNREGILGMIGYTVLYLLSEDIGAKYIFNEKKSKKMANILMEFKYMILNLILFMGFLWFLTFFSDKILQEVSRRLVNLTFIIWALAHNGTILLLLAMVDLWSSRLYNPVIFRSLNRNQLVFFLIANLLTGAVNISMKTIYASDIVAFAVLNIYMFSLFFVFVVIDEYLDLTLKFW